MSRHHTGPFPRLPVGTLLVFLLGCVIGSVEAKAGEEAKADGEATVYHIPGKGRFHHGKCKRIVNVIQETPDQVTRMTHREGVAKGLCYCSRCPVDASLKASPDGAADKGPNRPATHQDVENGALVSVGPEGRLAYTPYTDKGDRIMDHSHCGYRASEVPLPDVPTALTLAPLPDTPPAERRPLPTPPEGATAEAPADQGPMVFHVQGKKRFHAEGCPRLKAAQAADPDSVSKIPYVQGVRSDMQYCSRCPKDAPKVDVEALAPVDREVFLAYPEGPDSRARIQAALDRVAAMEPKADGFRGAVLLERGVYCLKGGLTVPPGVVLRGQGDGPDGTVLVVHHPQGVGIRLGHPKVEGEAPAQPAEPAPVFTTRIADAYVPVGSASLTVEDASGFAVGADVHIIKTTNNWLGLRCQTGWDSSYAESREKPG